MNRKFCRISLPGLPKETGTLALIIFNTWGPGVQELQVRAYVGHIRIVCSAVLRPENLFNYYEFRQWVKAAYCKQT